MAKMLMGTVGVTRSKRGRRCVILIFLYCIRLILIAIRSRTRSTPRRLLLQNKANSFSAVRTCPLSFDRPLISIPGQHLLWTEQSSPENLDSIAWPRAASSAELFWTGAGGDVGTALPRLHDVAYRFRQRGVGAIALQPLWCALRPGACDLNA